MKTLIMLVCMLVMLCCGVCWGEGETISMGITIITNIYTCSLCGETTSYSYERCGLHFSGKVIFADLFGADTNTGWLFYTYNKKDYWSCPECMGKALKRLTQ